MRKVAVMLLVVMASVAPAVSAMAESATKEECVAKCKEAVQLINEKGLEAALQEINKKDGKFVWKDSYVFVEDFKGTFLAQPLRSELIGTNWLEHKGIDGKFTNKEFIEVVKTKGEGWVEYMHYKPAEFRKPAEERIRSKKMTYVLRVPGKDIFVGAGTFE